MNRCTFYSLVLLTVFIAISNSQPVFAKPREPHTQVIANHPIVNYILQNLSIPYKDLNHSHKISQATFSSDGTRVATASWDCVARIWDVQTGQLIYILEGHTGIVYSVAFNHDGTKVVTASGDNTAKIWNAETGQLMHTLTGHTAKVFVTSCGTYSGLEATFSPDSTKVVTASQDSTAKIWDAQNGQLIHTLEGHTSGVCSAAFSPDGTKVVTQSADRTAKVWNVQTGLLICTYRLFGDGRFCIPAFSPNGTKVMTVSAYTDPYDHKVCVGGEIWDIETEQCLRLFGSYFCFNVFSSSFSPDCTKVVTPSDNSHGAEIWDTQANQLICKLERQRHTESIFLAVFNPDSTKIVTTSGLSTDHTAKIWDAETGQLIHTLTGHAGLIHQVAFSQDGSKVVTVCGNAAKIWDLSMLLEIEQYLN